MFFITLTRKRIIALILGLLALIVLLGWFFLGIENAEGYKVKIEDAISGVTVTGTVRSDNDISLTAGVTGKISKILFKEGEFVTRGQLLALIDRNEVLGNLETAKGQYDTAFYQLRNLETEPRAQQAAIARAQVNEFQSTVNIQIQELERARVQLSDATSDARRFKVLYQEGAVSLRDYERAENARFSAQRTFSAVENQVIAAKARLNQAQENLSLVLSGAKSEQIRSAQGQVRAARGGIESVQGRLENYSLRAPVAGYITRKILDIGEVTTPSTPVLRLVRPDAIYIEAQVEENELNNVRNGQNVYIVFDAYPSQTYNGRINRIIREVDPITGTFIAKVYIYSTLQKPILVGMTSDLTIVIKKISNALTVPNEFVNTLNKKTFVYKLAGGRAKRQNVDVEIFDNNRSLVIRGLKKDDIILKGTGNRKITDNSRVKIKSYYRV